MKNSILYLMILLLYFSCKNNFTFSAQDISNIELVEVDHPYIGQKISSFVLKKNKVEELIKDLQFSKQEICKFYSCYVIKLKLTNGELKSYRTNGTYFESINDTCLKGPFKFLSKENIVTKYWGIQSQDFCKIGYEINDSVLHIIINNSDVKTFQKELLKNNRTLKIWCTNKKVLDKVEYYLINVGEDNSMNYVSRFHFLSSLDNKKVFIFDVQSNKSTPILKY
jgi:hypothetical protein